MRMKLFWILGLTAVLASSLLSEAYAVSVNLNVLDSYITVGEDFDVEVWADGEGIGEDLLAFGFDVGVTGPCFAFEGYVMGPDFTDFSDASNPANVSGAGIVFDDDVLLATLNFRAIGIGMGSLKVLGLYDGRFYGLVYELSGADISASAGITVNPVPEPASMLLLVSGLVGLGAFRNSIGLKR